MKTLFFTLIMLLVVNSLVYAQDAVFTVILNKGQNSYEMNGSWNTLAVGTRLNTMEKLKVTNDGYVALLHSSGSNLELENPGEYSITELTEKIASSQQTLLQKYGKYLMSKLEPEDDSGQNMNVTGAVERGTEGMIDVYLPNAMDLFGEKAIINWEPVKTVNNYVVTIKDMYDQEIEERVTNKNSLELNLNDPKLKDQCLIIVNVKSKDHGDIRSREYGIKKMSGEESDKINKELTALKAVTNENNSINNLLIASFFEEQDLLIDAMTYYNIAMQKSSDTGSLKILYDGFLVRNGLKK